MSHKPRYFEIESHLQQLSQVRMKSLTRDREISLTVVEKLNIKTNIYIYIIISIDKNYYFLKFILILKFEISQIKLLKSDYNSFYSPERYGMMMLFQKE